MPDVRSVHRSTLSEVAARAGVSVTTASYILNGRAEQMRISEDTAARVIAAAQDLAYRPDRNARSLRMASTATLGVISSQVAAGQFANRMLRGASAAARARGLMLLIGETEGDPALEAQLVEEMIDRRVEGILYLTVTTSQVMPPAALRQHRSVLVNCLDPSGVLSGVLPAEYDGGRTAAEALLAAGLRDAVYLVGNDTDPFATAGPDRLRGITDALGGQGVSLAGNVLCDWTVEAAYDALSAFLAAGGAPGALICLNDRIAMGCYQALGERCLSVPEQVAVVSFDGSELARWLRPSLTSVAIPYYEMGMVAVESVLSAERGVRQVPMPLLRGESV